MSLKEQSTRSPLDIYLERLSYEPLDAKQQVQVGTIIYNAVQAYKEPYYLLCRTDKEIKKLSKRSLTSLELSELIKNNPIFAKAFNTMYEHNLRYVVKVAKKYRGKGLNFFDLIQEGNIGLGKAIQRFDPVTKKNKNNDNKPFKFTTYATSWIRQSIEQALREQVREISVPREVQHDFKKIKECETEFHNKENYNYTDNDIYKKTKIPLGRIKDSRAAMQPTLSLQQVFSDGKDDRALINIYPDHNTASIDPLELLEKKEGGIAADFLEALSEKEKEIIEKHFGLNGYEEQTLTSIAEEKKLTLGKIKKVKKEAMQKMQQHKTNPLLTNSANDDEQQAAKNKVSKQANSSQETVSKPATQKERELEEALHNEVKKGNRDVIFAMQGIKLPKKNSKNNQKIEKLIIEIAQYGGDWNRFLETLPKEQKKVLTLLTKEGKSPSSIAEQKKVTNSVSTILAQRGINHISEEFNDIKSHIKIEEGSLFFDSFHKKLFLAAGRNTCKKHLIIVWAKSLGNIDAGKKELNNKDRIVFDMFCQDGKSPSSISTELNISNPNVTMKLKRIISKLEKHWEETHAQTSALPSNSANDDTTPVQDTRPTPRAA